MGGGCQGPFPSPSKKRSNETHWGDPYGFNDKISHGVCVTIRGILVLPLAENKTKRDGVAYMNTERHILHTKIYFFSVKDMMHTIFHIHPCTQVETRRKRRMIWFGFFKIRITCFQNVTQFVFYPPTDDAIFFFISAHSRSGPFGYGLQWLKEPSATRGKIWPDKQAPHRTVFSVWMRKNERKVKHVKVHHRKVEQQVRVFITDSGTLVEQFGVPLVWHQPTKFTAFGSKQ